MKVYQTLDNGIRIVEYEDSLAAAIADMWNKSNDSWGGGTDIRTAEHIISQHSGGSFFNVYIAMDGDEAVGYCSFARYYKDADTLYISVLNVRPDYHGKKVGKALVLMCVERTIEMGYPRLDIHTWPGNTKAVPLYKKCGYLWEDRADSTHLANFIPTVLSTELTKGFFEKASWYDDSTRIIEIKPDGVKVNKFEVFGYSWAKDGETLAVGFERTGRRIRMAETNDYKIEFMAESHELAFGLDYSCTFSVENKTGKPLDIKIKGKDNKNIKFDYTLDTSVEGSSVFNASFFVGAIDEEQDIWRMHPCVLADVYINGKHAEFGLGIHPKYPLTVSLAEQRQIPIAGMVEDCYINIKSALSQKAAVSFTLPENNITKFCGDIFSVDIDATSNASIKTQAEITGFGHAGLPVVYNISIENADGSLRDIVFEKTLHITNRGLSGMFSFEDDNNYCIVNSSWQLNLSKNGGNTGIGHITSGGFATSFQAPKLGKPYDDEFNLAKPSAVRMYEKDGDMVLEADFISGKFEGMTVTEIFTLSASGVATRRYKVTNTSAAAKSVMLYDGFRLPLGMRTVFHYDGAISRVTDGMEFGFSDIEPEKLDENWVFEESERFPRGVYWPPEYRINTQWGSNIFFEHNTGELCQGEAFETKPVVFMYGVFTKFNDFRNYVFKIFNRVPAFTENHVQIKLNGYNPFVTSGSIKLDVLNNRSRILEGELRLESPDGLFESQKQHNPADTIIKANTFDISLPEKRPCGGIGIAELTMDLASCNSKYARALFFPDGKLSAEEKDGIFSFSNGAVTFKASPAYAEVLYSLVSHSPDGTDNEWLFSKHPVHEPYAWWNPFIGGIQSRFATMNNTLVLREAISADFTEIEDSFGNKWSGIRTTVSVNNFDEHKGAVYEQYFLTMPGLPVLCHFFKLTNNTGLFKNTSFVTSAMLNGGDNMKDVFGEFESKERQSFCLRMGTAGQGRTFDKFLKVSSRRSEKLYIFRDTDANNDTNYFEGDNKVIEYETETRVHAADKDTFTSKPVFFVISGHELPPEALCDLERVVFS